MSTKNNSKKSVKKVVKDVEIEENVALEDDIDICEIDDSIEYIYLIQSVFKKTTKGDTVYKYGKTTKLQTRFKTYPKGSRILLVKRVKNCHFVEDTIKRFFLKHFVNEKDYGYEYFSGDVDKMITCINKVIEKTNQGVEDEEFMDILKTSYKNHVVIAIGKHLDYVDEDDNDDDKHNNKTCDTDNDTVKNDDDVDTNDNDNTDDDNNNGNNRKTNGKYSCDKCGKTFMRQANLDYHLNNKVCVGKIVDNGPDANEDGVKINKCTMCNKTFSTATSMYRHMKHTCKVKKNADKEKEQAADRLVKLEESHKLLQEKIATLEKSKKVVKSFAKKVLKDYLSDDE